MQKRLGWMVLSCTALGWMVLGSASYAGAQDLRACGGEAGFPAWVQSGVYSGTIGTLPVYLQVSRDHPDRLAYFYQSKGVNIELSAFHDGDDLILQEQALNRAEGRLVSTGCLHLKASGKDLTGRWAKPDATGAMNVTFRPLNVMALPLNLPSSPGLLKMRRENPLAFLKLNRPWTKVTGGFKTPYSGLFYPRLPGATAALNTFMQDKQLEYAAQKLDCTSMGGNSPADAVWFGVTTTFKFQTPHLLSITEGGDGYCGGAHPFLIFTAYTVNRQTGTPFKPTDLWPKLTPTRLLQLYSRQFKADFEGTDGLQTMLTKNGLAIYNDNYSEAARSARTESVTLPYAGLKAEANPKSPYYRDIYH